MKLSEKIKIFIVSIIIISIACAMINQATSQVNPKGLIELEKTICIQVEQSSKKFATTYKIVANGKRFYVDSIILKGDEIRFIEFNRNGSIRQTGSFLLTEVKIYQSK